MKKLITLALGSLLFFVACTKKEEGATTSGTQVAPPPVETPAATPGAVAPGGAVDPHAGHGHAPGEHPEPK